MAAVAPKAPVTFTAAQRRRAVEAQQAMATALRDHRFEEALEHARTALALDPNNAMVKEFIRLLEEKQDLDATDEDSDGEGLGVASAGGAAAEEGSDDEESDEDDDDEGEDEDEGEEGEGESGDEESSAGESSEEEDEAVVKALEALRLGGRKGRAAPGPPQAQAQQEREARAQLLVRRSALRAALKASIVELRHAQHAAKLAAGDPLLGA